MAHAMRTPAADPVFQRHPKLTFTQGAYTWQVERRGTDVTYTVSDGTNSLALPVHWIFGDASQTYVLEYNQHYYESRVSYYLEIDRLDFTVGDEKPQMESLTEAMGRQMPFLETRRCFECHSTGAVADDRLQPASSVPGVQCEHCHSGADLHLRDIVRGGLASVPPKLGHMATEDISNFCGQCHRSFGDVVRKHMFGTINVRFQPYRLANAKCYDGADPRISCLACHDPHRNLVTGAASYDARCLACHSSAAATTAKTGTPAATRKPLAKSCPMANSGCTGCHMPKIELSQAHRAWSDHFIRVVRAGAPYPE